MTILEFHANYEYILEVMTQIVQFLKRNRRFFHYHIVHYMAIYCYYRKVKDYTLQTNANELEFWSSYSAN